jgi:tetratricopeptide (TPR) repeat protein
MQARLASLSPSARELASVAAVIGREFTFGALQQASGKNEDTLVRDLDELWQRRIVREHGADAYDFSHGKLRDVAYAELSAARRRLLHRRFAQALEALHASAPDTVSGQIAMHDERAGLLEAAIPWYQRAANFALQVFANADAIEYYRRALMLIEQLPAAPRRANLTAELLQDLGQVLTRTASHDEARAAYQKALQHAPPHDAHLTARLQRMLANTYKAQGRYAEALQVYALAEAALERVKADAGSALWEEWLELQFDRFSLEYGRADLDEMTRLAEAIKPVVERHGTSPQRVHLYRLLNQINFRRDGYTISDETLAYERAAFAAIEASGDPNRLNANRFHLGFVLLWRGLLDEAEEQLLKALAWDEQTGEIYEKTLALTYLAIVYRKQGRADRTHQFARAALESAAAANMAPYSATARANLAWVAWQRGNSGQAEAEAHAALDSWSPAYPFQWTALLPLLAIEVERGRTAEAVLHARALFAPHQQRLPGTLDASFKRGIQLWEQGAHRDAHDELARALDQAGQLGFL